MQTSASLRKFKIMITHLLAGAIAFAPSLSWAAANRCESVFQSMSLADVYESPAIQTSVRWLTESQSKALAKMILKADAQGKISPLQIHKMGLMIESFATKQALHPKHLLRLDLSAVRKDSAQGQLMRSLFIADFTAAAEAQGLMRDPRRLETLLHSLTVPSVVRSSLIWTAVHLSLNAVSITLTGQANLSPLYLPSLRSSLRPEQIYRLALESTKVGFDRAFEKLAPELKGRIDLDLSYKVITRVFNIILAVQLLNYLWNDLPTSIDDAKADQLLDSVRGSTESMEEMLIESNMDLIAIYEEKLKTIVDVESHHRMKDEIQRLQSEIADLKNPQKL